LHQQQPALFRATHFFQKKTTFVFACSAFTQQYHRLIA